MTVPLIVFAESRADLSIYIEESVPAKSRGFFVKLALRMKAREERLDFAV